MYHHKDYNAFAALIGSGSLDCIIFWKWKHNASSNISLLVIMISDGNI
jgi:hypothetical protein